MASSDEKFTIFERIIFLISHLVVQFSATLVREKIQVHDSFLCDCLHNKTNIGDDELSNKCLNELSYNTTISLQQRFDQILNNSSNFKELLTDGTILETCEEKYASTLSTANVDSCSDYFMNFEWNYSSAASWETKFECGMSQEEDPTRCTSINKFGCCYAFQHDTFRQFHGLGLLPTMNSYSDKCPLPQIQQILTNSVLGSVLTIFFLFPIIGLILKRKSRDNNWIAYTIILIQIGAAVSLYILYRESVNDVGEYDPAEFFKSCFMAITMSIFIWDFILTFVKLKICCNCCIKM